ncbi:hypothetical protein F441_20238 [Phytophthora nicotianae CJ01A1]|uniref:Uncharacterized protein n=3 Tax=Phytophthora nicotianae TaxID=4792 RepID=W2Y7F2_PHYNI|nr:hypothetical protein F444_20367 [Phytophthora nicotianae P1976]ETP02729.1 hypothetical protein F441_20238 [Phytophthora nicotianae CJ01A1]ETP30926.1 hypothetical protein F442_20180 [Phytophthora nicotianae P10297]
MEETAQDLFKLLSTLHTKRRLFSVPKKRNLYPKKPFH